MNLIKRLIYGALIGIASIAPGISGGTIAIAMGFYENLIHAVANIFKDFKKHFAYLFPYGIGAIISIAALSVIFDYMFTEYPLPTNMLFIGFILGTLPFIRSKFRGSLSENKSSWKHIFTGCIFLFIVLLPVFMDIPSPAAISTTGAIVGMEAVITFFIIGVIIAATLVIPGLSGTMILTAIGVYKSLLHTASMFVTAVVTFDMNTASELLICMIPLGCGIIIGGFLIAKLLDMLFKKIPSYIYAAVIGLLCATPIVMLAEISISELTLINMIISFTMLSIGLFTGWKLGDKE